MWCLAVQEGLPACKCRALAIHKGLSLGDLHGSQPNLEGSLENKLCWWSSLDAVVKALECHLSGALCHQCDSTSGLRTRRTCTAADLLNTRYSQMYRARQESTSLKNFANFSRNIDNYDINFHTLVTPSIVRKCGKFLYIIYRIYKITLLLVMAT